MTGFTDGVPVVQKVKQAQHHNCLVMRTILACLRCL